MLKAQVRCYEELRGALKRQEPYRESNQHEHAMEGESPEMILESFFEVLFSINNYKKCILGVKKTNSEDKKIWDRNFNRIFRILMTQRKVNSISKYYQILIISFNSQCGSGFWLFTEYIQCPHKNFYLTSWGFETKRPLTAKGRNSQQQRGSRDTSKHSYNSLFITLH